MAHLRDYMPSSHWRAIYEWEMHSPQSRYKSIQNYDDGGWQPMWIDSNAQTSLQMQRAGPNPYTMVAMGDARGQRVVNSRLLNECVHEFRDPNYCANQILKQDPQMHSCGSFRRVEKPWSN